MELGVSSDEFAVVRGGGIFPTFNISDVIPVTGDSGGAMIDITDPILLKGDILGLLESGPKYPGPDYAHFSAASGFRDFARVVLNYNSPSIKLDINGDGKVDTVGLGNSVSGSLVINLSFGGGGSASFDTLIAVPVDTLAGFFPGDFNGDGFDDLIGNVAGTPLYFQGASLFDFVSNVATGWTLTSSQLNPLNHFTVKDFNGDSVSDVEVVQDDGSSTIYLGEKNAGLSSPAHLSPRGFSFYDPSDQEESFAMTAPGLSTATGQGALEQVKGITYLLSTGPSGKNYTDILTFDRLDNDAKTGVKSELGDGFGQAVAWGSFDGDTARHGLVIGAPGKTVNGVKRAGLLTYLKYLPAATAAPFYSATLISRADLGTTPQGDEQFGEVMSAGDFNGDGLDDLALGFGEQVQILYGVMNTGLSATSPKVTLLPSHFQVSGGASSKSAFGASLTSGDFNCDGYEDLAIGAPATEVSSVAVAGQVVIAYGGKMGIEVPAPNAVARYQRLDQSITEIGDAVQSGDFFGAELAAGNFNGDSARGKPCIDLAVGVSEAGRDGSVNVIFGSAGGLTPQGSQELRQGKTIPGGSIKDEAKDFESFGAALHLAA